jgi:hypothetical protein
MLNIILIRKPHGKTAVGRLKYSLKIINITVREKFEENYNVNRLKLTHPTVLYIQRTNMHPSNTTCLDAENLKTVKYFGL